MRPGASRRIATWARATLSIFATRPAGFRFTSTRKEIGQQRVDLFQLLDLGDFIGVEGECFLTKTGEPTLKVRKFEVLSKTLRPLPEKWHGLQDVEARYRQRYLDLRHQRAIT